MAKKPATKSNTIKKETAQQRTTRKKKVCLAALEKSLGVVTPACKAAEINRSTFYEWYKKDPKFKKAVDDCAEIALDFTESKLHVNIDRGNVTAQIFYLKTKGKGRGYIERTEGGTIDLNGLSTEQLERFAAGESLASVLAGGNAGNQ